MKRLIVLAALVAACIANAQVVHVFWQKVSYVTTQNLTGSAPSATTDGYSLGDLVTYQMSVCAQSGATLSGAGTLQAYVYSSAQAAWTRSPALDLTVNVSAATAQCQAWLNLPVYVHSGRIKYVPNAVTVSAGTTVSVALEGTAE